MTTLAEAICKGLGIQITQAAAEPIFANEPFIAKALAAAGYHHARRAVVVGGVCAGGAGVGEAGMTDYTPRPEQAKRPWTEDGYRVYGASDDPRDGPVVFEIKHLDDYPLGPSGSVEDMRAIVYAVNHIDQAEADLAEATGLLADLLADGIVANSLRRKVDAFVKRRLLAAHPTSGQRGEK